MTKFVNREKAFNLSTKLDDWQDLQLYLFYKIVQLLIKKGKKEKALIAVIHAFNNLKNNEVFLEEEITPLEFVYQGLSNIKPLVFASRKRARGKKLWYVPEIVTKERQVKMALFWLIKNINSQKQKKLHQRFLKEIVESYSGTGFAMAQKEKNYELLTSLRPVVNIYMFKKKKTRKYL